MAPATNPVLSVCSYEELKSRLDRLVAEYDSIVRMIASSSIKAGHLREVIQEIIDELDRRDDH